MGLSIIFNSFLLYSVFDATGVFTESTGQSIIYREQFYLSIALISIAVTTHVLYKGDAAPHKSLAHGAIVFCLYHSCQQTNSELNICKRILSSRSSV